MFTLERTRKSFAQMLIIGTVLSVLPPVSFFLPQKAEAAQVVNTSFSPKQGPFIQCPGFSGDCSDHWTGAGQQSPQLLIQGLQAGQIVQFDTTGTVDWGGNSHGTPNPSSCKLGPDASHVAMPKLIGVGQFTNDANIVIAPSIATPSNRGAPLLRDFVGGITVPAGATKLWGSFPDTRYSDNKGTCTLLNVQVLPPQPPPPPPTQCSDTIDNDGDGKVDVNDPGCVSTQDPDEGDDPKGYFDGNQNCQVLTGWTCDKDNFNHSVEVAFYNGAGLNQQFLGQTTANLPRESQVGAHCGGNSNHGFSFEIPASLKDNQSRQIYAYAINHGGQANNPLLTPSPITLHCAPSPSLKQCQDGIDNDGDGKIDFPADPGCTSAQDDDEFNAPPPPPTQCSDSIDNDGDGRIDYPADAGCTSPTDPNEGDDPKGYFDGNQNCQVLMGWTCDSDNFNHSVEVALYNGAGLNQQFLGVTTANLPRESQVGAHCGGNNNHGFSFEIPASLKDNQSHEIYAYAINHGGQAGNPLLIPSPIALHCAPTPTVKQCQDGIDNDGDGATDFPNDFSCSSPTDDDETLPKAACQDLIDNDGDGKVDFPNDPGCTSAQDNDESNAPLGPCSDGIDNDGDGRIDHPADAGCTSPTDPNEGDDPKGYFDGELYCDTFMGWACDSDNYADPVDVLLFNGPAENGQLIGRVTADAARELEVGAQCGGFKDRGFWFQIPEHMIDNQSHQIYAYAVNEGGQAGNPLLIPSPITFQCAARHEPRLVVTKTPPAQIIAGQNATYTFTLKNTGRGPAPNTRTLELFVDNNTLHQIDPVFSYVSSSGASCAFVPEDRRVICHHGELQVNEQRTFSITFHVPANLCGATVTNQVEAWEASHNPVYFGWDRRTSTVECPTPDTADLSITKSGPATTIRGGIVAYTLTASNAGPSTATNVVLADSIPSGLTFNPVHSDFNCTPSGTSILCDNVSIAPNQFRSFQVAFNVPQTHACNAQIQNRASVSGSQTDPNSGNNQSNLVLTTVTCPPAPHCSDGIDNDGDGKIDFPLDPGCTSSTDPDETDDVCVDVRMKIDIEPVQSALTTANVGGSIVTSGTFFALGNNASTILDSTMPITDHQLGVRRHSGMVEFFARNVDLYDFSKMRGTITLEGGTFTSSSPMPITITGVNTGLESVDADFIQITSPTTATFQIFWSQPGDGFVLSYAKSAGGLCALECQDGIDNDGDGAIDFPNDFSCSSPTDDDETLPKAACQDGIDNDGDGLIDFPLDPGCTSKQDNDEFNAPLTADLSITKSGPVSVLRGNNVNYVLTVTNHGPGTATNVDANDIIPAGLTFIPSSDLNCVQNGASVICNNTSLASGQFRTFTPAFTVSQTFACGGSIQNAASVSHSSTDPNPSNNQSNVVLTNVTCPQLPQCSDLIDNDGDGLIDFPADPGCTSPQDNDEFNAPPAPKQCQDGIDNDGDGLIDYPADPGCTSPQDDDEFNAPLTADLSITKSGPVSVLRGNIVSYTLTVTNHGPGTATNVDANDIIPAGLTFIPSSDLNCVQNGASVICNNTSLGASQFRTFTPAFTVSQTYTCNGVIQNAASVSASQTDPNSSNNQSNVVLTTVNCPQLPQCSDLIDNDGDGLIDFPADPGCTSPQDNDEFNAPPAPKQCQDGIDNDGDGLIDFPADPGCTSPQDDDELNLPTSADVSITKSAPSTIHLGGILVYTITATNTGPGIATNVLVKDPIPTALGSAYFLPSQSGGCALNTTGTEVHCGGSTLTLISGGRRTFQIAFEVPATTSMCGATVSNILHVEAAQEDPQPGNNVSNPVATTVVCLPADVSVTKGGPSTVPLGGKIVYTATVSNTGPGIATDVLLTDFIPAALSSASFLPAESPGCHLNTTATAVECGGPTLTLIPGGRRTFTIAFTAPTSTNACTASPVVNQVSANAAQTDPNASNNTSDPVATTVQCTIADVSVTKSAPATIFPGGTLIYTVTVTNTGPGVATNVLLKDPVPVALGSAQFLPSQSGGCSLNTAGTEVHCGGSTVTLISGGRRTFQIAFAIPQTMTCNTTIANQATVEASEADPQPGNNTSSALATTVSCQ